MEMNQSTAFMNHIGQGIKAALKATTKVAAFSAAAFLLASTSQAADWPEGLSSDMRKAGIAIADTWIDRRDPTGEAWAWGEGVLSYGLVKMAETSKNEHYLNWLNEYNTYHDVQGKTMEWSDHLSPGIASLYITKNLDPNQEIKPISEDVIAFWSSLYTISLQHAGLPGSMGRLAFSHYS